MKMIPLNNPFFEWLYKYRKYILVSTVFALSFFLRAYDMGNKYPFGWDQVDNAWAAKNMIVDHKFPLVGMVAKQNTGFFIGPIYYYFVAFFYWFTDLNPIASQYIALVTSIFTFLIIFFVVKKLFNFKVAVMACFINTISFAGFSFDSVQWPVSFLPGISLLIFYFLHRLIKGKEIYIIYLAIILGIAFHIHFTAVFFPIIILLCLPLFPWSRKFVFYSALSIPLFLVWLIPNLIYQFQNSSQLSNLSSYLSTYYHGFHFKRLLQLTGDGLIQFDPFLFFAAIKPFKVLFLPIFLLIFLRNKISRDKLVFSYLTIIFFLVPWIVFSTYKGEISDYYFSINRLIALLVLAYIISHLIYAKNLIIKTAFIGLLLYYSFLNLNTTLNYSDPGRMKFKFEKVELSIKSNKKIEFQEGVSESYVYYYIMNKKGIIVY